MNYDLDDVLQEVNYIRAYELDLPALEELPKGKTNSACDCAIAKALGEEIWSLGGFFWPENRKYYIGSEYGMSRERKQLEEDAIYLSDLICKFITDFDDGHWPQLIEDDKEENTEINFLLETD